MNSKMVVVVVGPSLIVTPWMYLHSGFRSGGTSAKTTLLENHPLFASQVAWYRMENGPKSKNGKKLAKK